MDRREFLQSAAMTGAFAVGARGGNAAGTSVGDGLTISVHSDAASRSLPHFWEECVGSDRAVVGLRQQWLLDLDRVRSQAGIKSVRFHGLFNDEMGVWPSGAKEPNFLYVDTVFDAMLERKVKPLVELSFMPGGLASGTRSALWYHGNTTNPKDMAQWSQLVTALTTHCVERYGIEEVSSWKFEVWNEPNLPFFWAGSQADYFLLYQQSALAIKRVNQKLSVGGPSTAQAAWVGDLLDFCSSNQVPIDFVSTHVYPDDSQKKVFGEDRHYAFEEVIPRALTMVREQIRSSKYPDLPLYLTEWSSQNPAFIAHTIKSCIGLADIMSYWTFDSVYEELGVPKTFLNNSFGLIGMRGIPRPSFHTFALLHKLGSMQLATDDGPILATRREDGSLAILAWNLIPQAPGEHSSMGDPNVQQAAKYAQDGEIRNFTLKLDGRRKHTRGRITRVDSKSGDFRVAYREMGSPAYPTPIQIEQLKRKGEIVPSQAFSLDHKAEFRVSIPPNGVVLIELS